MTFRRQTELTSAAELPPERRRQPELDAAAAVLLLQQAAGNRAVGRVLARRAKPKHAHTGLRDDAAVQRFVTKAVAFRARNGDGRLVEFALYLGAAVNEELAAIGCPAVAVDIAKGGLGAAGEFHADSWQMILNPADFSPRPEVRTMGELTSDEAALIAGRVMHEARHAEQHFRVARLQAAEGEEIGAELDENVAKAALAAPLDPRRANAREVKEAREWRTNSSGEDANYREAVTWWRFELLQATRMAHGVTVAETIEVRERLGSKLQIWNKPGAAAHYIRSHLASAQARKATLIIADITRINADYDRAQAAWRQLPEQPLLADFAPLKEALAILYRAVVKAYRDQPVESDAYEAGTGTFDVFNQTQAAADARRGSP